MSNIVVTGKLKKLFEEKFATKLPRRVNWHHIKPINNYLAYIKNSYNKDENKFDRAYFLIRNSKGDLIKEFNLEHSAYTFNSTSKSDRFVINSDDMDFYYYSLSKGFIKKLNLNNFTIDKFGLVHKYHLRCVNISPEGNYLIFTYVDKLYLMDSKLNIIMTWKTPEKPKFKDYTTTISTNDLNSINLKKMLSNFRSIFRFI